MHLTLPLTSVLGKLEPQAKKKKKAQREILNLKQKIMRSLCVCLIFMFQCVYLFLSNIAEINL